VADATKVNDARELKLFTTHNNAYNDQNSYFLHKAANHIMAFGMACKICWRSAFGALRVASPVTPQLHSLLISELNQIPTVRIEGLSFESPAPWTLSVYLFQ
jgi:hypothetical protein